MSYICQPCTSLLQSLPARRSSFPITWILPLSRCFCLFRTVTFFSDFRTKLCPEISQRLKSAGLLVGRCCMRQRGETCTKSYLPDGLQCSKCFSRPRRLKSGLGPGLLSFFENCPAVHSCCQWRVWSPPCCKGKTPSAVAMDMLLAGV